MYTIYSFHRQTDVRKRSDLLMVTSFLHNGWLLGRPSAFFWSAVPTAVSLRHGFAEHIRVVAVTALVVPIECSGGDLILRPYAHGEL